MTARASSIEGVVGDGNPAVRSLFGIPWLPTRRVWVVDPGAPGVKALLVENRFGRMRVLRHATIPDVSTDLAARLPGWDEFPIAIALPQGDCLSQVVELAAEDSDAVHSQIETEVARLSGLSDRSIQFHYNRLRPFGSFQNPFWITLCKEEATTRQLAALLRDPDDLAGLTTAANAILAAHRALHPERTNLILAEIGTESTTIAVERDEQGVFAAVLPAGADDFPPSHPDTAGDPDPAAHARWLRHLDSCLTEIDEPSPLPRDVVQWPVILCGAGALNTGFRSYLDVVQPGRFALWTTPQGGADATDPRGPAFAVAFGTALQAAFTESGAVSMLPPALRRARRLRERRQWLESLTLYAVLITAVALLAGAWHQWNRIEDRRASLTRAAALLEKVRRADEIRGQLDAVHEFIRPIADLKLRTGQSIETLSHLRDLRRRHSFFLVLLADAQSYFAPGQAPGPIQDPAAAAAADIPDVTQTNLAASAPVYQAPFADGFVAELCIPESGSALRKTLGDLVSELADVPLFRSVDSLPPDLTRRWVDSNVTLSNSCFTLALELAAPPTAAKTLPAPGRAPRNANRSGTGLGGRR